MAILNDLLKDKRNLLLMAGIFNSKRAFLGPEVLHIDLTNWCNFNCIACWCRSPLLGDKQMPDWEKKLILPLDLVIRVFEDLFRLGGLRQVKLVGGGEPFMHPDILTIVEYIKSKDSKIEIDINTNFSLVDKNKAKKLIDLGVDSMTVSIWAGSPKAYLAVHPNQKEDTFNRIKETLEFIASEKRKLNLKHPRIIIHDVVFNLNHQDLLNMVHFGLDIEADSIQLVPVDPVKGKTDSLLLNDEQRKELLSLALIIKKNFDSKTSLFTDDKKRSIMLPDFDMFIKRLEGLDLESGAYDENMLDVPCYTGWLFARIMTTGNVVPCCKGHRMSMGNIHEDSFKKIWQSKTYREFRRNGLFLSKCDKYFSKIGNEAVKKTGCYNCDNLWQNVPTHNKVNKMKKDYPFYSKVLYCVSKLLP